MALHSFAPAEIADGTNNLDTALVYQQTSDVVSALADLGYTSLAGGSDATSKAAMLNGTRAFETALLPFWRGHRLQSDQLRLLPAAGAYTRQGRLMATDEISEDFLEGWRLTVEKTHAGTLLDNAGGVNRIRSTSDAGGSVEFVAPLTNVVQSDPDIWPLAARILPPL